jgi:ankyrin repeat protein
MINLLLCVQYSSNIDVLSDGNSALHLAATLCKSECIKVLVRAGANATQVNVLGQTALDISMTEGHNETIELVSIQPLLSLVYTKSL